MVLEHKMTNWKNIQDEISQSSQASPQKPLGVIIDEVRRSKYALVKSLTGRPLVIYATAFHNPIKAQIGGPFLSIDISDKDGFYEVIRNITGSSIDIFIHSPGGSAEATESIVKMIRNKFSDVRFIITGSAKSAATMLAMSGNSILMDDAAEVGPIDPQVRVRGRFSPAGSIIEQFNKATEELSKNPATLPVWIPILQEFAPALLIECANYLALSRTLVSTWLKNYMFLGDHDAEQKAEKIAEFLANEKNFLSHARRVDIQTLKDNGVKAENLSGQSGEIQDAIRQLHLIVMTTLDNTDAIKIFENSEGGVMIRQIKLAPQP